MAEPRRPETSSPSPAGPDPTDPQGPPPIAPDPFERHRAGQPTLTAGRLMRPWAAVLGGAALLVTGERLVGAWAGHSGARFDRLLDLSLVTFVSIGLVWAPLWTMGSVRRAWRRLPQPNRFACARQVLLQGLVVAPALWLAMGWLTRDVHGGQILSASALGSVLISLGGAMSLWLRAR